MQRRKVSSFSNNHLLATENILKFDSTQLQYVKIPMTDSRWDFGSGDFFISFITSIENGNEPIWLQVYNTVDGAQIIFAVDPVASFRIASNQGTTYSIPSNSIELFSPGRFYRLTIMRRGDTCEGWLNNNRLGSIPILSGHTFNFSAPGNQINFGTRRFLQDSYVKGTMGNFVVLKGKALDAFQMSYFHHSNIVPEAAHPFCVAHYPFNQSLGNKAFDCVGQYNYAKTTPLPAQHGDLVNFPQDALQPGGGESGLTLLSWRNLFTEEEVTNNFPSRDKALRLLRANSHYLSVSDFNPTKEKGYTYMIGFALDADRNFVSLYGSGGGEGFLSKRSNSYNPWKRIIGGEGGKIVSANFGIGVGNDLTGNLNKPQLVVFTEKTPDYLKCLPFGFKGNEYNSISTVGWDEIPDNLELRIGCQDAPGNNSLNGYLFFVGIWKGVLSEYQIKQIVNNTMPGNMRDEWMIDCELYLTFDEIINDTGTFKIKDWSPQNRTVLLHNYSLAEITHFDPQHMLYNLDDLR